MIYPSIDKLLNIVDSKYMLVHVASKRSKQMLETSHYQMRINNYISNLKCIEPNSCNQLTSGVFYEII